MLLTRTQLLEISETWGKPIRNWNFKEIITAWRTLENSKNGRLKSGGWAKKLKDMRSVFDMENIDTMAKFEKEIRLISNSLINDRIDADPAPTEKRGANTPPYTIWKEVINYLENSNKETTAKKRLRLAQGHLLMCWTLSTGARLDELLRLRRSDISIIQGELNYLKITIRRGKSNRGGKKLVFYYAHENLAERKLCPILAFIKYAKTKIGAKGKIFEESGDLLFPKMVDVKVGDIILEPKGGRFPVTGKSITTVWKKACEMLKIPQHHHIEAHSGRNTILNAAWAYGQSNEQILDITNWTSTRVLPEYVSGPNQSAINVKLSQIKVEDIDKTCKHLLQ